MKHIKLFLAITLSFLLVGCMGPIAYTMPTPTPTLESNNTSLEDDIYIFFTSDVHCGVDENLGFTGLKALVDDTRLVHPYVSLVDLGDYLQGGTLGSLTKGKSIIEIMNEMNYDYVTIGNHEFDYTVEELDKRLHELNAQVITSNVKYTGHKKNIFEEYPTYVIHEYGPVKVAFLGVLTPTSITSSTPKYFMEDGEIVYDFYSERNGDELAERVQSIVDEARSNGADYVVALTHLGSTPHYTPYDSISLIHKTNGIDVVLDGHSHSVVIEDHYPNKDGKDVILSSVGTKMQNAGELIIGKDGSLTTMLVSEFHHHDVDIESDILAKEDEQKPILDDKIGVAPFDFTIMDDEGHRIVRSRETNLADFVADAYRYVMDADIGLTNGGGVRTNIVQGDITFGDILNVNPFQNTVGTCRATGQQILDALEFGAKETLGITVLDGNSVGEFGAFLQVSGLKYTIDTSIPTGVVLDDNGMLKEIKGERRVQDVQVLKDGQYVPLDPNEKYVVASISYLLFESGDGNTAFAGAEMIEQGSQIDVNCLRDYLTQMNGIPDTYRNPLGEGRITVK